MELQANSRVPVYKQLALILKDEIKEQHLSGDQRLPSINYLSARYHVSRETVEKAYRELKKKNLIEGVPRKGYFLRADLNPEKPGVLLLFNKLSAHKQVIYESLTAALGERMLIDFHVYNNDFKTFQYLLNTRSRTYAYYVLIPHFYDHYNCAKEIINAIPKNKLLLLDKRLEGITGQYACVYQDFEQNIYSSLSQLKDLFSKYQLIKLVYPANTYQPKEIINGFQRFCINAGFRGKLVREIEKEPLSKGEAYITIMEDDLVALVKKIKQSRLKVGSEIGILSYNESPLKEVLLEGITVISTDFKQMGQTAAQMMLENRKGSVENPFRLIRRKSL